MRALSYNFKSNTPKLWMRSTREVIDSIPHIFLSFPFLIFSVLVRAKIGEMHISVVPNFMRNRVR